MSRSQLSLIGLLFLFASPLAAQLSPAQQRFYQGFYYESGTRDLAKAKEAYAESMELAKKEGKNELRRRSALSEARVLLHMGETPAARSLLKQLLREDPQNAEALSLLRQEKKSADPELVSSVTGLIMRLDGAEWKQAASDLSRLRDRALPQIAAALNDRRIRIVREITKILVRGGWKPGLDAVASAIESDDCFFKKDILGAALAAPTLATLDFYRRLDRSLPEELHPALADLIGRTNFSGFLYSQADRQDDLKRFLSEVARSPSLRIATWNAKWPTEMMPLLRRIAIAHLRDRSSDSELLNSCASRLQSIARNDISVSELQILSSAMQRVIEEGRAISAQRALHFLMNNAIDWSPQLIEVTLKYIKNAVKRGATSQEWNLFRKVTDYQSPHPAPFDLATSLELSEFLAKATPSAYLRKALRLQALRHPQLRSKSQSPETVRLLSEAWSKLDRVGDRIEWIGAITRNKIPAYGPLVDACSDQNEDLRNYGYHGLATLARMKRTPKLPFLSGDLEGQSKIVNRAIEVASKYPELCESKSLLTWLQNHQTINGQIAGSQALAASHPKEAVRYATKALSTVTSRRLRKTLVGIIRKLDHTNAPKILAALIVKRGGFGQILRDNPPIEESELLAIAELVPSQARDEYYFHTILPLQEEKLQVQAISEALKPGASYHQLAALRACKGPMIPQLAPILLELLWSPSAKVRASARKLLETWRFHRESQLLLQPQSPNGEALKAARSLAESKEDQQREAAAYALGATASQDAVIDLLQLSKDPSAKVRKAALEALRRLGGISQKR